MSFVLSPRSEAKLVGVHPALVAVVRRAIQISACDFAVTEGLRTLERQQELVKMRASQTLASKHITGHAVDLAPIIGGQIRWDWPPFYTLAKAMKDAARELKTPIEWGGDWTSFKDGPHFQIDPAFYPMPRAA